jgi:hypothetical protein
MAIPSGTQASSTQKSPLSLKLLFRHLIKSHSKAAAILAANATDSSRLRASLSSSMVTTL